MNATIERATTRAAHQMHRPGTVQDALETIVRSASEALPRFDHVGVSTVEDDGSVQTRATTSVLVLDLDALQQQAGEGPLIDSRHTAAVVAAPDIARDDRWPGYVPAAAALGLSSQLSVRLHLADRGTVGSLNLYSTTHADIDALHVSLATHVAAHAGAALGRAQEHALSTRAEKDAHLVGQAIGLLMERHRVTDDEAHSFLWRASKHTNTTVSGMAASLVGDANTRVGR